jgi:large subunit ribosomal protein L6
MSRIGKKPILIPESVEVKIEGRKVAVKGPKGELRREFRPEIKIEKKEKEIVISPAKEGKKTRALWGLTRVLVANMIQGVVSGYQKKLEIQGVGYRTNLEGEDLVLELGFSHPVKIKKPEDVDFSLEKNIITVSGINKELVGQLAAKIRRVRPPEPYKGKGIRYLGEVVRKKAGKKAAAAGSAGSGGK